MQKRDGNRFVKKCFIILIITCLCGAASAQEIHIGVKAGANYSWVRYDDADFRKNTSVSPVFGYSAGLAGSFKMKDRFFLHTELIYSTKGRTTKKEAFKAEDHVIYNYIELPLTYNMYFKGKLQMRGLKYFKWYAGVGPNFSYWLGGKGTITNDEVREYLIDHLDYKVKFGKRSQADQGNSEVAYYDHARRMQLGVNIGGGVLFEPVGGSKIAIDARFEIGHSQFGRNESPDFVFPTASTYQDNLLARNMGVRLSVMYMMAYSTDKKIMNKGKSTKKKGRL